MGKPRFGESCIVPDCLSACYPGCGIRFHSFPKNLARRKKWLRRINIPIESYHERAVVCHLHFNKSDYSRNNRQLKLKLTAVPHIKKKQWTADLSICAEIEKALEELKHMSSSENDSEDDDDDALDSVLGTLSSSEDDCKKEKDSKKKTVDKIKKNKVSEEKPPGLPTKCDASIEDLRNSHTDSFKSVLTDVCRICLATDCKMFSLRQYMLEDTYLWLTGTTANMLYELKMPEMLCFECLKRLQNFVEFRTKSVTAWTILKEMCEENKLNLENIKSINREAYLLKSKLDVTVIKPLNTSFNDYIEIKIKDDVIINETNEYNDNENSVIRNDNDDNEDSVICNDYDDNENSVLCNDYDDNENSVICNDDAPMETEQDSICIDKMCDDSSDDFKNLDNVDKTGKIENDGNFDNATKEFPDSSDDEKYNTKGRKRFSNKYNQELKKMFKMRHLTPEEQRAEIENRKNSKVYINANYKCNFCYRSFHREPPFEDHMKKHTNECGEFVCDICKMHYLTRFLLANHIRNSHDRLIECRLCPFKTTLSSAISHHRFIHNGRRHQCPKCPMSFAKPTTYISHLSRLHPEDAICHLCGESYVGINSLQRHVRSAHRGEDMKIQTTNTKWKVLFNSQSIVKKEIPLTPYSVLRFATTLPADSPYCDTCDVRFKDEAALHKHTAVSPIHSSAHKRTKRHKKLSEPVTCEQCGQECPGPQSYARHFREAHPNVARAQRIDPTCMCEVCGKMYPNLTTLKYHRDVHSGERRYECTKCPKKFKTKQALSCHTYDHTRSRRCAICGNTYASVSGLWRHMKTHTGNLMYSCEPCNKRFVTPSERRVHVLHYHMGVPWPKKKPKSERNARRKGGKFISDADMDVEIKMGDQSANQDMED